MKNNKTIPSILIFSGSILLLLAYLFLGLVDSAAAQSLLHGTALTSDPSQDLRPTWSPDGTQLAFFSGMSGNNDIWIMDADGANKRQITIDPADDRRPGWSPNGEWLVFDSDRSGNREIWVISIAGREAIQVTHSPASDNFPSWSLDGSYIAYYAYEGGILDIWVIAINELLTGGETGPPMQITTNLADETKSQCTFACHSPSWSPDSTQLVYSADNQSEIWVIDIDGSNPYQVINDSTKLLQGFEHFPSWTPDGRVLFLFEHQTSGGEQANDIWVMRPDGSNPTLIYSDIPHGGPLELSSDAVTVAFHSPRAGNFDIYTADIRQSDGEGEVIEVVPTEIEVIEAESVEEAIEEDESPQSVNGSSEENNESPSQNFTWLILILVPIVLGSGLIWYARKDSNYEF